MKLSNLFYLIISVVLLSGCASKEITTLTPRSGECIVAYKAEVLYKGADVTDKSALFFNGEQFGVPNESGSLKIISLPCQNNYLSAITYYVGGFKGIIEHQFENGDTSFQASEGKINYLGDITFNWQWHDESVGVGEIIGGLVGGLMINKKGEILLESKDNSMVTAEYLEKHFNTPVDVIYIKIGSQ